MFFLVDQTWMLIVVFHEEFFSVNLTISTVSNDGEFNGNIANELTSLVNSGKSVAILVILQKIVNVMKIKPLTRFTKKD